MSDGGSGLSGSFDHPDGGTHGQEPAAGVLTANRAAAGSEGSADVLRDVNTKRARLDKTA